MDDFDEAVKRQVMPNFFWLVCHLEKHVCRIGILTQIVTESAEESRNLLNGPIVNSLSLSEKNQSIESIEDFA